MSAVVYASHLADANAKMQAAMEKLQHATSGRGDNLLAFKAYLDLIHVASFLKVCTESVLREVTVPVVQPDDAALTNAYAEGRNDEREAIARKEQQA
jgi:hypothetical protein